MPEEDCSRYEAYAEQKTGLKFTARIAQGPGRTETIIFSLDGIEVFRHRMVFFLMQIQFPRFLHVDNILIECRLQLLRQLSAQECPVRKSAFQNTLRNIILHGDDVALRRAMQQGKDT